MFTTHLHLAPPTCLHGAGINLPFLASILFLCKVSRISLFSFQTSHSHGTFEDFRRTVSYSNQSYIFLVLVLSCFLSSFVCFDYPRRFLVRPYRLLAQQLLVHVTS
jgi:hypothetical protein